MIILGTNSIKDTGYNVDNSCRFNDDDGANMNKSYGGSTDTNFTFSAWIKRGDLGNTEALFSHWNGSNDNNRFIIYFEGDSLVAYHNSSDGSANDMYVKTTAVYRDPSAWYHFVVAIDTTQGTAANRVKIYTNGVLQTSLSQTTYPAEDYAVYAFHSSGTTYLGRNASGDSAPTKFFDGYMAEVFLIDGTTYAASNFGEYDSDSPTIWKPKDCKDDLTFGTNGTYLDFEDSDNLGDDESGNGNDLTETNIVAADQATDTPTNNFCTLNSSNPRHANLTMSEGNCALASSNSQWLGTSSTIAVSAGKWYVEWKYIAGHNMKFGIVGNGGVDVSWLTANQSYGGYSPIGYEYQFNNSGTGYRVNNNSDPSWTNGSFTAADSIIIMAFDIDAGKIWWGRNGTWFNNTGTANPATGTDASTTGISSDNGPYVISCALEGSGSTGFVNFGGSPSFAISSGNADANGYGNFEYAPPSGYFSLCTKNLAEYGG